MDTLSKNKPTDFTPELPYTIESLLNGCELLRLQNAPEEALHLLETHAGSLPVCAEIVLMRAALQSDVGNIDMALACFRQALSLDTTRLKANAKKQEARFGICFTLYMAERWSEALTELEAFVAESPAYPNAAWLRAGLLRRLYGDSDVCVQEAYALVIKVDPDNAYAQVERADVLRASGDYEAARDVYVRYQSPAQCDDAALRVEAAFKLGCVALVLQDNSLARDSLRAVLAAAPDYPDAQAMLALIDCGD